MVAPNPQLEAVIRRFGAQAGVGSIREEQLRSAVTADADRLQLLNGQANSGQLRGFRLETTGNTLIGSYDKANGVASLPAASFTSAGTEASTDLRAVVGIQAISAQFAHRTWQDAAGQYQAVSQNMLENLQATFDGSPSLATQLKGAVLQAHIEHFDLLGNDMAAGATYDGSTSDGTPRGINLPPLALQTKTASNPGGKFDPVDMTFVLGHEIQHGFNDAAKDAATHRFLQQIAIQAGSRTTVHDYSDELREYLAAGRDDEARAQIAGWNALLSREKQRDPYGDGIDLMFNTQNDRVLDFLQPDRRDPSKAVAKPGLTFNPDGSLSPTPANVAAMGKHYFDRPSPLHAQPGERPVTLGEGRPGPSADYTNYYGTWAVERIIAAEDRADVRHRGARPQIAIDMAGLGLREDLIEMEGLDLGTNRASRPYLDTSRSPAATGHFHHTQDASMGHDHQHVPVADLPRIMRSGDAVVDAWIEALQDGDHAAARAVQRAFADSIEGRGVWAEATGTAVRNTGQGHGPAPSPERALPASDGRWPDAVPSIPVPSGPHEQAELQQAMQR